MSAHLRYLCFCLSMAIVSCNDPLGPAGRAGKDGADLALREGVTGQIKNADGTAVAEATVLAASVEAQGPPIPEIAIVSDANGRYEWPLRPGHYELTVISAGYERASQRARVTAGQLAILDFQLSRRR